MEQRIKDILLAPYHNPDFYWDTPDLEKATASLLQLIREAQHATWQAAYYLVRNQPPESIKEMLKEMAELKAKESE